MKSLRINIKKVLHYFIDAKENRNGTVFRGYSKGIKNVSFGGKNRVPGRCNFSGSIKLGYGTTLGYNNFLHGNIEVGKYCQFGADVAIHSTNHPTSYLSTYINKNLFDGALSNLKEIKTILIGNDVWIGHNAIVVGGVNIGNGAIVASGSVVTKDVPPYSIVAGVPAKVVRKRFADSVIREIEELKWWDMDEDTLREHKHLFTRDLSTRDSLYDNQ